MAVLCRALRKVKYKGQRVMPGETFLMKKKDAYLYEIARIAEVIDKDAPGEVPLDELTRPKVRHEKTEVEEKEIQEESQTPEVTEDPTSGSEADLEEPAILKDEDELQGMTKQQIRDYAKTLDLDFKPSDSKTYMIGEIIHRYGY